MSRELMHDVGTLLVDAGYGPGSGVTAHAHGDTVIVSWKTDLPDPFDPFDPIAAEAGSPRRIDEVTCMRVAVEAAITAVFRSAGYAAVAHPDGFIMVTRRQSAPPPAGCGSG